MDFLSLGAGVVLVLMVLSPFLGTASITYSRFVDRVSDITDELLRIVAVVLGLGALIGLGIVGVFLIAEGLGIFS